MDKNKEQNSKLTIKNEAVPFAFEELFFSRTDDRGIILSGNSIFQKISMYSWDELINKPHNLIRHPDMPKAVFWLLWHTIKQGNPIGAYVKNKAKDGRYYWVFAIATPIEGGYLSVRLKPSSPILSVVEEEYKNLLELEKSKKLSPQESGEILLGRLNKLGFTDYISFMSTAISTEIKERNKHLKRNEDNVITHYDSLAKYSKELLDQVGKIFVSYNQHQYVPLNLRVQATQLGEVGAAIEVISNNYNVISLEIHEHLNNFIESANSVFQTINNGLFLTCTARIQNEVLENFKKEQEESDAEEENQEVKYLQIQRDNYHQKALDGLDLIEKNVQKFNQNYIDIKRLASALEVTRIMGKVESSRITTSKNSLASLIGDLDILQNAVSESLKEINNVNYALKRNINILLKK